MKYELKAPKYFVGQIVDFVHHNGNTTQGKIVCVTTSYSKPANEVNTKGTHIYAINTPTSKKRSVWIGERNVIG